MRKALIVAVLLATACGGSQKKDENRTVQHVEVNVDGHLRLPDTVVPKHYALDLRIDPASDVFTGSVRTTLEVLKPTRIVYLHADQLTIRSFALEAGGKSVGGEVVVGDNGGVALVLKEELPAGKALLALQYEGSLDEVPTGLYRVKDGDRWYAFTQFEPLEARQAFPCFDEPRFKATFDTTLRVPTGLVAATNAKEIGKLSEGQTDVYRFATTKPLPTYLVAFAVGDFDVVEAPADSGSPVPLRLIATKGKGELGAYMLEKTPGILNALLAYFGGTFPFEKLDIVAVPNFSAGAMENVGLVTFRETLLLLDPQTASVGQRRGAMSVMIHELAHMWFGNLVTMPWWDDLWLNESFATWMAAKQLAVLAPELESDIDQISGKSWVMYADAMTNARVIRNPITSGGDVYNAFDGITYGKGARVLAMFESWLGAPTVQTGVQAYMAKHAYGSATTQDFLAALDEASGKPVGASMATFLDQPGTPVFDTQVTCDAGSVNVKVTQTRYKPAGSTAPDAGPWATPVCLKYEDKGKAAVHCELVSQTEATIALPTKKCPKWVYPNADERGYYLWNLPSADVEKLAASHRKNLSLQERVGLLNNVRALAASEKISADTFVKALLELAKEDHRTIFEGVLDEFDGMDRAVPAEKREKWSKKMNAVVAPRLKKIGFAAKKSEKPEAALIRTELIKQSVRLGNDAKTREQARELVDAFLKDMKNAPVDTSAVALRIAAETGNADLWLSYKMALAQAPTPAARNALIAGLGSFKDTSLLQGSLALMLDGTMRSQDFWSLVGPSMRDEATFAITWTWFSENYAKLVEILGNKSKRGLTGVGGGFCTPEGKAEVEKFFADPSRRVDGIERNLANTLESIDRCIRYRAYISPALDNLLK